MFTFIGNSIKDLFQSDSSQKPFKPGCDDLKQSRPALNVSIIAAHWTPNGRGFQYLLTLLLKKSCAVLKE